MTLTRLAVHNIRNYELASFDFSPHVTLILGPNGSGKTSLLEAVYMMYRGASFRGSGREVLAHDASNASIRLESEHEGTRALDMTAQGEKITKKFEVNGKKTFRLPQKHRLPVVLFEPDELRMLSSSPERRRKFIDGVLSRLDPHYATTLARYQRTLLQRNELLKQHESSTKSAWESHLFAWDVKLAELAAQLVAARREFVDTSNQHLSQIYSEMAGSNASITARYVCNFPADTYQQHLLNALSKTAISDAHRGHTTIGPHRDDVEVLLGDSLASEVASRGEMRTIMLAYKLLEVQLQSNQSAHPPLILLDDVFSELDSTREQHLMASLQPYQTIITATDLRDELKIRGKIIQL